MNKEELGVLCYVCLVVLGVIAAAGLLFLGLSNDIPVELTVVRLALVAPGNGTASVAYNLSFAVAVFNPNTVMHVWRAAPLDAELRLGGRPFARVRIAGAEPERIRPKRSKVYRVAAKSAPVALESDAAAAFAAESAVGVFRLELIVDGEFKYEGRIGRTRTKTRCRLRLPLSTAAKAFARFKRTLPQPGAYISIQLLI